MIDVLCVAVPLAAVFGVAWWLERTLRRPTPRHGPPLTEADVAAFTSALASDSRVEFEVALLAGRRAGR